MTDLRSPAAGGDPAGTGSVATRLLAIIALVLVFAALRIARPVVLPLAIAAFIGMVAWPLQPWLERRLPRWLALTITLLVVLTVLGGFLIALSWSTRVVIEHVSAHQERLDEIRRLAQAQAQRIGVDLSDSTSVVGQTGILRTGARRVYLTLTIVSLALGFTALGLAEACDLQEKVDDRFPRRTGREILRVTGEIAGAFRRYFAAKTLTSFLTGAASGLLAFALGIDLAAVWAFTTFLLEYAPTVGSVLAVIPPTLFAFIQFDGVTMPLVTFASFTVLQLFMGNIVDPRVQGRMMSLSPLVVLLSVVLWGWLWGAAGALLGVPMTVAAGITCRHFESTRWISDLITGVDADRSDDHR